MIAYTVRCTFKSEAVADEWIQWLRREHLAQVCAAGALDAEVIRFDADNRVVCEVRYHFASREAFAAYERDHAPRLRAEGLKGFPPERGLRYERSIGEVVARSGGIRAP
jgi:hypothetical protein